MQTHKGPKETAKEKAAEQTGSPRLLVSQPVGASAKEPASHKLLFVPQNASTAVNKALPCPVEPAVPGGRGQCTHKRPSLLTAVGPPAGKGCCFFTMCREGGWMSVTLSRNGLLLGEEWSILVAQRVPGPGGGCCLGMLGEWPGGQCA